jgi:hypothetical protein
MLITNMNRGRDEIRCSSVEDCYVYMVGIRSISNVNKEKWRSK